MIVLISPENDMLNEIALLQQLFKAGLTHFHLRKPTASLQEYEAYIKAIPNVYHEHIVIHNHHDLTNTYALKGIHLEEQKWRDQNEQLSSYVEVYKNKGILVSSSYHEPKDLENQIVVFDYYILSPVFAAISKMNMKGREFEVHHISKFIVGMGGINETTTPKAVSLGFKGVGALGGVWNTTNPVASFKALKVAFEEVQ